MRAPTNAVGIDAPSSTRSASATITVTGANPGTMVVVTGGALPVTGSVEPDQTAAVLVPLRAGQANSLRVESVVGATTRADTVAIRQVAAPGNGTVRGRVLDAASGKGLKGARVAYAKSSARANKKGLFTLKSVPTGFVVASVTAPHHVAGAAAGYVGPRASVELHATALPRTGRSTTMTPHGGVIKGPGWRVVVPRGAVHRPTAVHVRATSWTGDLDDTGIPTVEVLPEGLRFDKPVQVRLDKQMLGLPAVREDVAVRLSLVSPSTLAATTVPATVSAQAVRTHLGHGGQVRVPPPAPRPMTDDQCTPFSGPVEAGSASQLARLSVNAWGARGFPVAKRMFLDYLTPGPFNPALRQVSDTKVLEEFRASPNTIQKVDELLRELKDLLEDAPPALQAPSSPYTSSLETAGLGKHVDLAWTGVNTPGLIAGGPGSLKWPWPDGTEYFDERNIAGDYRVKPTASERGVLQTVILLSSVLDLEVVDSVDFCPGDPGDGAAQFFGRTVAMSRLQVTSHPDGFWAKPIRWRLTTKLAPQGLDVTDLYPSNDPDQDGFPDTQPWKHAHYALDNCPGEPNPGQADSDGDGVGDACQCPGLGPRQLAAATCGGLSYDIQLHFVCNQCPYGQSTYTANHDIRLQGTVALIPGALGSLNYTSAGIDGTWVDVYSGAGGCGRRPPDPAPDPPGPFCDLAWHLGQTHDTDTAWTVLDLSRDPTSRQLTSITLRFVDPDDENWPRPWPTETLNYTCVNNCSAEMNGPLTGDIAADEIQNAYDYTFTIDGFEPDPVTGGATATDRIRVAPYLLADGVLDVTATWTAPAP